MKKNKGFTLVEVIVVAVIVAALAAVAVGVYFQYTRTARRAVATNAASALANFCGACANANGTLTGFTAGTAVVGAPIKIQCNATDTTTINTPGGDVTVVISATASPGTVKAWHVRQTGAAADTGNFSW